MYFSLYVLWTEEENLSAASRSGEIEATAAFQISGIYTNFKIFVRTIKQMHPMIRKAEFVTQAGLITDSILMG